MTRTIMSFFGVAATLLAIVGCDVRDVREASKRPAPAAERQNPATGGGQGRSESFDRTFASTEHDKFASEPDPGKVAQSGEDRKIIQKANIMLKVLDFSKAEQSLYKLVQDHKGFTAQAELTTSTGAKRHGTWRVRIPVASYDSFCSAAKGLGEVLRSSTDAQEVTLEYFDLQSRIANKEAELASLRQLFDKGSGKIEDVLAVQRELSRAQGELEQMKGRQKLLNDLLEMTTITINLEERDVFVPPTVVDPPPPETFWTKVEKTFFGSVDALVSLGKGITLAAVAVAPWTPVLAVLGFVGWFTMRRQRLKSRMTPSTTEVHGPTA